MSCVVSCAEVISFSRKRLQTLWQVMIAGERCSLPAERTVSDIWNLTPHLEKKSDLLP